MLCASYLFPESFHIIKVTETEDPKSALSFEILQNGEFADAVHENHETVEVPVKRLLSRHRRYISPGTRWDWLVGWETVSENFEITFYLLVRDGHFIGTP